MNIFAQLDYFSMIIPILLIILGIVLYRRHKKKHIGNMKLKRTGANSSARRTHN